MNEKMKKYKVEYEFMISDPVISDGKWHVDFLDNNGDGFTLEEANDVARQIEASEFAYTKRVIVEEMAEVAR